jgi:hypothetical protein
VRVHAPPADHVAARRRQVHPPGAGEHGPGEEDGGADAGGGLGVELVVPHVGGAHAHLVVAHPLGLGAQRLQQVQQGEHVLDARDVLQEHVLVGQQGRGQHGQRRVLVARWADGAFQALAALYDELGHSFLRNRNVGTHEASNRRRRAPGSR